jgi:2,3-bisphosphoglycerate-independent phosphoglycerate mutase
MDLSDIAALARPSDSKVVLLVLDGLGGVPIEPGGATELEAAATPHLDALVRTGTCGLHVPVAPGVTPGSGPGHLALFGYDPLRYRTGRGVLAALGIGFDLRSGDVAARGNFCTLDGSGSVSDRRAGRIPSDESAPLVELLDNIEIDGADVFVQQVKEHRFLLVLRPDEPLGDAVADTDPGQVGLPAAEVRALDEASRPTVRLVRDWLDRAAAALAGQPKANGVLLRGFSRLPGWPSFEEVFGMRALGVAAYPMYRGVARLVGMETVEVDEDPQSLVAELERRFDQFDFFFLHYKAPDKAGEDGDFDRKVQVIEAADSVVPRILEAGPDVVLVTGDHSTPALLRNHSWHPVPFLLSGGAGRADASQSFGETACASGALGTVRGCDLMRLVAARAGRLSKYGA